MLHYYGDAATEAEIQSLKQELIDGGSHRKVEVIPGDIADPETSSKVDLTLSHDAARNIHFGIIRLYPRLLMPLEGSMYLSLMQVGSRNLQSIRDSAKCHSHHLPGICPFAEFLTMPHATWERTRQV